MEQKQHHYTGLTDAEVLASREKHGVNILTPPEEQSTWNKIKDCISERYGSPEINDIKDLKVWVSSI